MRKITMAIAALGLTVPAQFAMPAHAQNGYNGIPDFCKAYVESGADPNLNRGECISFLTSQFHYVVDDRAGNAYAVHACAYLEQNAPDLYNALWDSKQQCVDEVLYL